MDSERLDPGQYYCNGCGADYREKKLTPVMNGVGKEAVTSKLLCAECTNPTRPSVPTFFCLQTPGSLLNR